MDRIRWSQLCKAVRSVFKDHLYSTEVGAAAEGETFEKIRNVSFPAVISGQNVRIQVALKTSEFSMADGYLIVWREGVKYAPPPDATYSELWSWATGQEGLLFVAFDVKSLSLVHGSAWKEHNYYQWSRSDGIFHKAQLEHVQFTIAMIEGIDTHMAILPAQMHRDATDLSFDIETIVHGLPLWIPLGMVADEQLETAVSSIIQRTVDKNGWYTNPTNGVVFEGWTPEAITHPRFHPDIEGVGSTSASFQVMQRLWEEVKDLGGRIHYNPFAPVLVDFVIWLPDIGYVWVEHKFHEVPLRKFTFQSDVRRNPFRMRRVWHFVYCQGTDGVVCIPRDQVDYTWATTSRLPPTVLARFRCTGIQQAITKIIGPHAQAARAAVLQAMSDLQPADIIEGLPTSRETARLYDASKRDARDDPIAGRLIRQRTSPGASSIINRWCRTEGNGVCMSLGGGHPSGGTHVVVQYGPWSQEEKDAFDIYGELPLHFLSNGVGKRKYIALSIEDHSVPSNLSSGIWYPFAIRKDNWRIPMEKPLPLILGSLTEQSFEPAPRSSWMLLLPGGFTAKYSAENFVQEVPIQARHKGGHVFRKTRIDENLVQDPKWASKRSTVGFTSKFLADKNINLARYVLNLMDGSMYREIMKVLEAAGPVSISNPLLRTTSNRSFEAEDYQGVVADIFQMAWDFGYQRQDGGQ